MPSSDLLSSSSNRRFFLRDTRVRLAWPLWESLGVSLHIENPRAD